jgi:hypothetical protein
MIQFPLNLRKSELKEDFAWSQGSLWLSLDRFERFWPAVGLTLSNAEAVKAAVREMLRVQYAIKAADRARWAADPDAPDDLDWDHGEELAKTCFRAIIETAGTQDAECIARWLAGPVLAAIKEPSWTEHQWHYAWSGLLYHMWKLDPLEIESSYGIPSNTVKKIVEIAAHYRDEDDLNHDLVEAADQEPLSGWDAIAYANYRWETTELSPLDGLWAHLRWICFERTWPEIVRCTRPADIDALIEWGRAKLGPTDPIYEQVVFPDDIRAAWHQAWRN